MTKPEKRWQLLLVADDGRIIPFKRIKGIAVTLVALIVFVTLVCGGLGWKLAAERLRHSETRDQLTEAKRKVTRYKSEHELIAAELVLAEARMEKAGLSIPRRQKQVEPQKPVETVDAEAGSDAAADTIIDDFEQKTSAAATSAKVVAQQPSVPPAATPVAKKRAPKAAPIEAASKPKSPVVALGDLTLKHDLDKKILMARFRVNNSGPRYSPVAGRCVVVLKNERMDRQAWLAMPDVTLVNGKPDGGGGQAFKISRFIDMKIKAPVPTNPSSFNQATVYVFDTSGTSILEKDFPVDLPASKPAKKPMAAPPAQPAAATATTDTATVPTPSPPADVPVKKQTPLTGAVKGAGTPSIADPSDADSGNGTPGVSPSTSADDPSLIESAQPVEEEDTRSRF